MDFSVDRENHKINVKREFAAPVNLVWDAWTKSEILDKWWAPKPWKAKTKTMDFREGGRWLYAMVGPDGTETWCKADYNLVNAKNAFGWSDAFCDADGNVSNGFPSAEWKVAFREADGSTMVNIVISHETKESMDKYLEMGFREGFVAALENLDAVLEKK